MFWNLERVMLVSFSIVFLAIMYTVLYVFDKLEYSRKGKKIKPLKKGFKSLHKNQVRNGLYQWRKEHHYSQQDIAARIGTDQTSISNWERGFAKPYKKHIEKLAWMMRCSQADVGKLLEERWTK